MNIRYCNYRDKTIEVYEIAHKLFCVGCPYYPFNEKGNCEHLRVNNEKEK